MYNNDRKWVQMMDGFVLFGDIVHTAPDSGLSLHGHSHLVVESGRCAGVFPILPERFRGLPIENCAGLIVPGFADLHLHAPQHRNLGLGLDMELLDWLNTITFPTEAHFSDEDFAAAEYEKFSAALRRSATTRACVFATIHGDATLQLMRLLEQSGLFTFVGKVNMDRNSPAFYVEDSASKSLRATERWLDAADSFTHCRPILTPRFVPSCSDELLSGLGRLARERKLPLQSHLSENLREIAWVKKLCPDSSSYTGVYEAFGLLGERSIMAHCVHLSGREIDIIHDTGTFAAHCPTSNINVRSGAAPVRRYLDAGLNIGLGSDISGGHTLDLFEVMRAAIDVSKLRWRLVDDSLPALTAADAFALATRRGGAFFGKVGAFDAGYEADILVVDDRRYVNSEDSLSQRFERMVHLARAEDVAHKYVAGVRIF